jgi:hypothetical protein
MKTYPPCFVKAFKYLFALSVLSQFTCGPALTAVGDRLNKSLQLQVAEKSLLLLPASLRDVIHHHRGSFERGIISLSMDPFISPSARTQLEARLSERVSFTIQSLDARPKFAEVANSLGSIASMVLYLNLPEGRDVTKEDMQFVLDYSAQNAVNFPLVVYDRLDENAGQSLSDSIKAFRARRAALSERFLIAYPQIRLEMLGERINPRSVLFGISSLLFSHSINDLANIWRLVWRAANGDMAGIPAISSERPHAAASQ